VQVKELAFRTARSSVAGAVVRFGFAHTPWLLPLTVVERGRLVTVYEHPRPCFGTWHHIAVPSVAMPDVFALAHPRHATLRADLAALIDNRDVSALVNAGPRQDVGQLHVHLTDDPWPAGEPDGDVSWPTWDDAVLGLAALPDVERRFANGLSLLRPAGAQRVRLI
jgi:hypothetical protein